MHIHILGICGTFMAGVAVLARELGITVTGYDKHSHPPMSTQLQQQGIVIGEELNLKADNIIVGNVMRRGMPTIETILNKKLAFTSGPSWLAENVLKDKWVLAVSGTHGKTSTASMLAWILEYADLNPGFLIGGIAKDFNVSARIGGGKYFVLEADEYDCAFFDKRAKFVHYLPQTLIINNLEYDHADIYPDLAAIQKQFHHFIRTVPQSGLIIYPENNKNILDVLDLGCWTPTATIDIKNNDLIQQLTWDLMGKHNLHNALSAITAARHVGVKTTVALEALNKFSGIKRRMEIKSKINGITIYDDFAHHPTAIKTTINGLKDKIANDQRIIAVLDFASHTMRQGLHKATIPDALQEADIVFTYNQDQDQDQDINILIDKIIDVAKCGDHILIMSNGSFGDIHNKLSEQLSNKIYIKKTPGSNTTATES